MTVKSHEELSAVVQKLLTEQSFSLFAGAGVSKMAGLPIWSEYLLALGGVADKYEPLVAALIDKKVKDNLLLEAAHYYKTCTDIPAGELLAGLAAPLADYNSQPLIPLASLPRVAHSFRVAHSRPRTWGVSGEPQKPAPPREALFQHPRTPLIEPKAAR